MTDEPSKEALASAAEIVGSSSNVSLENAFCAPLRTSIAFALDKAVTDEREACAKIVDDEGVEYRHQLSPDLDQEYEIYLGLAEAIRARGKP